MAPAMGPAMGLAFVLRRRAVPRLAPWAEPVESCSVGEQCQCLADKTQPEPAAGNSEIPAKQESNA
ncbi:hypothetical protein Pla123a_39320 [Posidoniimonas polymericola]|uniref:Uncharacterized protein n=1 Tax=Posidoniimonas polymericola TaxID=2528002 RepID=A0A5C5YD22_9BACT|nr:hypothetical protein Pla123a_39320 [Posidoniimonas polymericola]